jgi:biopolymer transport protein TolR
MILGMSRRATRLSRHAKRGRRIPEMNLVSLMDIFTILVFFLLVNSSNIEVLPNPDSMQLPESLAQQPPRETTVLMVTEHEILVGGSPVMPLAAALQASGPVLQDLKAQLQKLPLRATAAGGQTRGEINIMADRDIPYSLLKKVMVTCTDARFSKISLAVTQRVPGSS